MNSGVTWVLGISLTATTGPVRNSTLSKGYLPGENCKWQILNDVNTTRYFYWTRPKKFNFGKPRFGECDVDCARFTWSLNPDHWSANFRKLKDFYEAEGSTYISTETLPVGFRNKLCLYFLKISKQICPKVCGPDGYHAVVQPNPFHPGRGYCSDLWVLFWSENLYVILSQIFLNISQTGKSSGGFQRHLHWNGLPVCSYEKQVFAASTIFKKSLKFLSNFLIFFLRMVWQKAL